MLNHPCDPKVLMFGHRIDSCPLGQRQFLGFRGLMRKCSQRLVDICRATARPSSITAKMPLTKRFGCWIDLRCVLGSSAVWATCHQGPATTCRLNRQLCRRAEQCLGRDLIWGKNKSGNNTGVEPTASLSSVSTCLLCHRPPQLNHGHGVKKI